MTHPLLHVLLAANSLPVSERPATIYLHPQDAAAVDRGAFELESALGLAPAPLVRTPPTELIVDHRFTPGTWYVVTHGDLLDHDYGSAGQMLQLLREGVRRTAPIVTRRDLQDFLHSIRDELTEAADHYVGRREASERTRIDLERHLASVIDRHAYDRLPAGMPPIIPHADFSGNQAYVYFTCGEERFG